MQNVTKSQDDERNKNATDKARLEHNADMAKSEKNIIGLKEQLRIQSEQRKAAENAIQTQAKQNQAKADKNHLIEQELAKRAELEDEIQNRETRHEVSLRAQEEQSTLNHQDAIATQRSVKNLQVTLHGLERATNPIRNALISYTVIIPLQRPELAEYHARLRKATSQYFDFLHSGGRVDADPNFENQMWRFDIDAKGKEIYRRGVLIRRGSPLFPTDVNQFPGNLFKYPIQMFFWHNPSKEVAMLGLPALRHISIADMSIGTYRITPEPQLIYTSDTDELHLRYDYMDTGDAIKLTGKIVSIPDLFGSTVEVAKSVFYDDKGNLQTAHLDPVEANSYVDEMWILIAGRTFVFTPKDMTYFNDGNYGTVCSFTFKDNQEITQFRDTVNL